MPIELHCTQCNKLIRAPDNAGGRYGKCPHCQNKVYVPMPADQIEEIALAPIDEEDERRELEARREAARTASLLSHATEGPGGGSAGRGSADNPAADFSSEVVKYILAMRDSKLEDAQAVVDRMRKAGKPALDYVEKLAQRDGPVKIENVPPPLAKGFINKLLSDLG